MLLAAQSKSWAPKVSAICYAARPVRGAILSQPVALPFLFGVRTTATQGNSPLLISDVHPACRPIIGRRLCSTMHRGSAGGYYMP